MKIIWSGDKIYGIRECHLKEMGQFTHNERINNMCVSVSAKLINVYNCGDRKHTHKLSTLSIF